MGVQFGPYPTDQGTPDANFGAAVDGNYGFGDACFDGTLDATDPSAFSDPLVAPVRTSTMPTTSRRPGRTRCSRGSRATGRCG